MTETIFPACPWCRKRHDPVSDDDAWYLWWAERRRTYRCTADAFGEGCSGNWHTPARARGERAGCQLVGGIMIFFGVDRVQQLRIHIAMAFERFGRPAASDDLSLVLRAALALGNARLMIEEQKQDTQRWEVVRVEPREPAFFLAGKPDGVCLGA